MYIQKKTFYLHGVANTPYANMRVFSTAAIYKVEFVDGGSFFLMVYEDVESAENAYSRSSGKMWLRDNLVAEISVNEPNIEKILNTFFEQP